MQAVREIYRAYAGRWDSWRIQSVNRRIFSAIVTVGGITVLIKLMAAAKEVVVARQFGTGDALDAFLIAFLLPSFAINVVAGSFNAALIPTFIQVREHEGREAAQRLFSNVMVWSTALLVAVSVLLGLLASYILPILGSGFGPGKLALTRSLFFVLLPALTVSGLATIWSSILNASERFALAAVAPMITPIVTVLVLLVMGNIWGVYSLAVGMVCGFVLEASLLSRGLRRHGFSIIPRWHGIDPATKQVINQYVPMIAGAFLMSSTTLVDQSMAAMLGSGSVSALSYGNKVVAFAMGIGATALSTAVLPHFSHMVAMGDWLGVRHTLKTYARLILLVTVPVTLVLVYFSESLVGLLFQRGAFTVADTHLVGQVQAFYLMQAPFYVLGTMLVRLISSLKANYVLMWGTIISVFLNVTLNYLFMKWLGIPGIALSTSVVYTLSFGYLLFMLIRLLQKSEDGWAINKPCA
jgi:putative peptidoglycan lipid II flippase